MNFKNRLKKYGFSLMEILIAVFIVAILALVTLPVINKQINKTNEYSYYLAYKTVEKMAGQIVALGDPKADLSYSDTNSKYIANDFDSNTSFTEFLTDKIKHNPVSSFITSLPDKFAYTQRYILTKFIPKSVAATVSTGTQEVEKFWGSWDYAEYDDVWLGYQVCANNKTGVFKKTATKTTSQNTTTGQQVETITYEYYEKSDFENCVGYTKSQSSTDSSESIAVNDTIKESFYELFSEVCDSNKIAEAASFIKNQNSTKTGDDLRPNAKDFCNGKFATSCHDGANVTIGLNTHKMSVSYVVDESDDDEDDDEDDTGDDNALTNLGEGKTYLEPPTSQERGACNVTSKYTVTVYNDDSDQYTAEKPSFSASWCTDNGYKNMTNVANPNSIDCQCAYSNYVVSTNNEKVCVQACEGAKLPYAKVMYGADGKLNYNGNLCCATDYDESGLKCCPENSVYFPPEGKCKCISGYEMQNPGSASEYCKLVSCPPGSQKTDDGVCVVNPPITSAKRLCEEITEHWNIAESSCNAFTSTNGFAVYNQVYQAALGNLSKTYLSVNSKIGAFKDITPNIEFSNGLKMWILGDKAASIPGLSYFNMTVKPRQNMCQRKKLTTNTAIACYNEGGYFCKNENTCLVLDSDTAGAIGDARACCSAPDISDLQSSAAASGDSNAWKKDQRVYGVSGFTVFVDINGDKGDGTLWDDVFPFFIGTNGTVYPAYPLDAPKGTSTETTSTLLYTAGNSDKDLPVDVYYYEPSDTARSRKVAFSGVSYARGMCSARRISKHTPYCLNLGNKFVGGNGLSPAKCPTEGGCTSSKNLNGTAYLDVDGKESRNPCDHYNCFVAVRKKLKSF